MQFNFMGGQARRDTLSDALGQKNQVLDAQLDFSKSAFVTGIQGAGQTMRESMRLGQAENEAVRRNKTTINEGMLSRQKDQDLLSQRLEADKTAYDRSLTDQKTRDENARKARLDDAADARELRALDLADARARDKAEYDRRHGLSTTDKVTAENKEYDKLDKSVTGELEGFKSRFSGELGSVTFDDDATPFDEKLEDYRDADGNLVYDEETGLAYKNTKRRKIQSHFDNIYNQAKGITNATERQAFIKQMTGQLSLTNIRGMYDSKFAEEERKRKLEDARAGATNRALTPLGG